MPLLCRGNSGRRDAGVGSSTPAAQELHSAIFAVTVLAIVTAMSYHAMLVLAKATRSRPRRPYRTLRRPPGPCASNP